MLTLAVIGFVFLATVFGTLYLVWTAVRPLLERTLTLKERQLASLEQQVNRPPPTRPEAPPSDLIMEAMSWQDKWAREDAVKRLYELHGEVGNWDNVRTIYAARQH